MEMIPLLLAALLAVGTWTAPARGAAGEAPPPDDPDLIEAQDPTQWKDEYEFVPFRGERGDGFDWRLTAEAVARAAPKGSNVVMSPIGVKLLLAMLFEGAAGNTASELARALQLAGTRQDARRDFSRVVKSLKESSSEYKLDLGVRMFLDERFNARTRYLKIMNFFYDAEVQNLDFYKKPEAARAVNEWVNRATSGYIRDLVAPEDLTDVTMMLANAVFFEGRWLQPFSEDDTAVQRFFPTPDAPYNTPFMQQSGSFYYYNSSAVGAQFLRLPYKGGKYSMFLLLPHDMNGADALVDRLSPAVLRQLQWNLTLAQDLRLLMPRFTFDTRSDMRALLRRLGISDLFERSADLQGISSPRNGPLFVNAVVQKALIEVTEQGTRAAAATQASTANRFGSGGPVFNARHPFLFFIEDETTATVLFTGKVAQPGRASPQFQPQPLQPQQPLPSSQPAGGARPFDPRFTFDLSQRFGGGADGDHHPRQPPAVITTNTLGDGFGGHRRPPSERHPEPTTQRPLLVPQPPQLPSLGAGGVYPGTDPRAQPQQPFFTWLWPQLYPRGGGFPQNQAQQQQPQLVLIPVYTPIRRK